MSNFAIDININAVSYTHLYAMGGSERNRQRFTRQTESTWECHPRTGRGNADEVL